METRVKGGKATTGPNQRLRWNQVHRNIRHKMERFNQTSISITYIHSQPHMLLPILYVYLSLIPFSSPVPPPTMGNYMSCGGQAATGKIVHWDGSVQEFDKPLTVAELMLEHPQHLVVDFHSAVTQRRPDPLPADKNLQPNTIYLMLPMKRGKPLGLNAQDSRRFLLTLNSADLHSKALFPRSSRFLPWLARMCHANAVATGQVPQKKPQISEKEKTEEVCRDVFSEILPERPEYLSREFSGKGWKPSLDTITEKNIETKISHWLFFKAF